MRVLTIYPYTFILIFITFAFAHNTNETISLGNIPLTSLTTTPGAPTSTTGGPNQDELSTVLDEDYSPQTHVQADQALPPPQHHEPTLAYVPYPSPAQSAQNPILHCIALIVLLLTFLGFISTFIALPFSFMPSDPRSSDARPSSSSSSGGSSSSSSSANPPQATPYISPNAWMSFFLFVCLVLIILQGPLGLTGGTGVIPGMGDMGSWSGGLPGCNGFVAGAVPWCQPVALVAPVAPVMTPMMPMGQMQVIQHQQPPIRAQPVHQMGGQGLVVGPQGGGEYSWYANSQQPQVYHQRSRGQSVQYQRPGYQVQVNNGGSRPQVQIQHSNPHVQAPQVMSQPQSPPIQVNPATMAGLANLENAFYPLLVGAIALLVVFDYAS